MLRLRSPVIAVLPLPAFFDRPPHLEVPELAVNEGRVQPLAEQPQVNIRAELSLIQLFQQHKNDVSQSITEVLTHMNTMERDIDRIADLEAELQATKAQLSQARENLKYIYRQPQAAPLYEAHFQEIVQLNHALQAQVALLSGRLEDQTALRTHVDRLSAQL